LIQNEFFVWTGAPEWAGRRPDYDVPEMIRQYSTGWRQLEHPSVAVWDANNETRDAVFGDAIIPAVRGLDLSNRNWENSYNQPVGRTTPSRTIRTDAGRGHGGEAFKMSDSSAGPRDPGMRSRRPVPRSQRVRVALAPADGEPTVLTRSSTRSSWAGRDERRAPRAQRVLLGAKTEYWRAHRNYAGILHFVYLTCSYPGVFTADTSRT